MSTGKIELSVGYIGGFDEELPKRVDAIEDELEETVKFEIVGEGITVPPISGGWDNK